jgi:hypothetical protein
MKHNFSQEPLALSLFNGTTTFKDFKKKLINLSISMPIQNPLRWGRCIEMKDNENKILGDGFELFAELLVSLLGNHRHVGLSEYTPINPSEDRGIDAFANNILGELSAVQIKFSADPTHEYSPSNSNLPSFINEAAFTLKGVDWTIVSDVKRLFFITSGNGIDWVGKNKWGSRIWVINGKGISQLVDGNMIFWNKCVELLKEE